MRRRTTPRTRINKAAPAGASGCHPVAAPRPEAGAQAPPCAPVLPPPGSRPLVATVADGLPRRELPVYVRERLLKSWACRLEDRIVQRVRPDCFTVRNPVTGLEEIWSKDPYRYGYYRRMVALTTVEGAYRPIDGSVARQLQECDRSSRKTDEEFDEEFNALSRRVAEERDWKHELELDAFAEDFADLMTNDRRQGKILRPVRGILVPAHLTGGARGKAGAP